jgi:(p)ppGpp synthase/HD superfamily hydrolase
MNHLIESALALALEAHAGQTDKAGAAYILHPMRLASRAASPEAVMAALLHDVVEDSRFTQDDLAGRGFPPEVLEAVRRLTRRSSDSYEEFIERCADHPLSREVKLLDLADNLETSRLTSRGIELDDADRSRIERYRAAVKRLGG